MLSVLMTRVIGICSGKGGVGKTTVATNLSIALKDLGKRILIIDCNLSTPHLAYYLGATDYKYTLNDALQGKVDITSTVTPYYGMKFIPASLDMKDLVAIDPMSFKKHLKKILASKNLDFVILDSAPGLGREAVTVLDAADEIIFVTNPFAPTINDVMRSLDVLKELKGGKNVSIVLNMVTGNPHEISANSINDLTHIPVVGEIPFDQNVILSMVSKSPIINYKSSSDASLGIRALAAHLVGAEFKMPAHVKVKKVLQKMKNYFTPQKVSMPQDEESVKEEVFIQK